jgi:hypothetical protein
MALLWCDGFDHYGGDEDNLERGNWAQVAQGSTQFTLSNAQARTGTYSLRRGLWNDDIVARRVLGGTFNTVGVGFAVYVTELPDNNDYAVLLDFRDAANTVTLSIVLQSDGRLAVVRGDNIAGTKLGTTSVPHIVAESWQHIEVQATSSTTAGEVEIRVNGVTVLTLTGQNTLSSAAEQQIFITATIDAVQGFDQIGFPGRTANGGNNQSSNINNNYIVYYDDIYAYDLSGSFNNTWLGDQRVYTLFPSQDTAQADWTPLSGNGFDNINDPADMDSSYVSAGIPGSPSELRSDFELTDLPATVGTVAAVVTTSLVRKLEAGIANFQSGIVSVTNEAVGQIHTINPTYIYHEDVFEYDPDTGASFTTVAVDSLQVQINRID